MLRPILIHPDPRLKKVCDPVDRIDDRIRALAHDMLDTMYNAPGIGLAAPQLGINARLLVMDCAKREDETGSARPIAMVNPEIVHASEAMNEHEEGCLSIPDIYAQVTRPEEVTVRWTDVDGAGKEATMRGIWATCVQHEIDHLNGRLFIDYLGPMRRQMITSKMKKLKRERVKA